VYSALSLSKCALACLVDSGALVICAICAIAAARSATRASSAALIALGSPVGGRAACSSFVFSRASKLTIALTIVSFPGSPSPSSSFSAATAAAGSLPITCDWSLFSFVRCSLSCSFCCLISSGVRFGLAASAGKVTATHAQATSAARAHPWRRAVVCWVAWLGRNRLERISASVWDGGDVEILRDNIFGSAANRTGNLIERGPAGACRTSPG
jgi:hypothetical protein